MIDLNKMNYQDLEIFKFEPTNGGESYEVSRGAKKSDEVVGTVVIPKSYNGIPVTSIPTKAFFMCQKLTSITIPDSVDVIGKSAFASCGALEEVVICNGVKEICDYAFQYCRKLKKVVIPDSVTNICMGAFHGCTDLAEVILPKNAKIGERVFIDCKFKQ